MKVYTATEQAYKNGYAKGYEDVKTNKMAAITINKMYSGKGNASFITKQAYPEGSTVSFDIFIYLTKQIIHLCTAARSGST